MTEYTELANRLRKRGERINKFGSPFFTEANANDMIAAADAIEKLVLELSKASNSGGKTSWIPATERLPNNEDDVLIYGERRGASGTKYRDILLTDIRDFMHQGYEPIAWMPLPEPPKEEQT